MYLENVALFLLRQGLIAPQSILSGDLKIISVARRNRNFIVQQSTGVGYLIKQPADVASGSFETLRSEASFYIVCRDFDALLDIRPFIPVLLFFEKSASQLVFQLIQNTHSLWDSYRLSSPNNLPSDVICEVGHCLGIVHGRFSTFFAEHPEFCDSIRKDPPWIFTFHKPSIEMLGLISPANYELVRLLQTKHGFSEYFDTLLSSWVPNTLIHGDIKSDNILVSGTDFGPSAARSVYIVDWECVQFGDSAWDVAGMLHDLALFWINTLPPRSTLEESTEAAPYKLAAIHGACRAFWRGYERSSALSKSDIRVLLRRAVLFTAARLVLAAYEMSVYETQMPLTATLLVQLALNIFSTPESAQVQIFGIYESR